jgi:hypothetical protein
LEVIADDLKKAVEIAAVSQVRIATRDNLVVASVKT